MMVDEFDHYNLLGTENAKNAKIQSAEDVDVPIRATSTWHQLCKTQEGRTAPLSIEAS